MSIQRLDDTAPAAPLFDGWEETIVWSCLQGVMGAVYADDRDRPVSAMAYLGDIAFFAGVPNDALVRASRDTRAKDYLLLVPRCEAWSEPILRVFGDSAFRTERYAIRKEPDCFDRTQLRAMTASLPAGCRLRPIDSALFAQCRAEPWSEDLVSNYADSDAYSRLGLGFAVTENGEVVSGASAYSRYRGGIEIEIDTKPSYRRRGLASACGAALVLACLDAGLYPSWDAANLGSVALAEKLGYHFSHAYTAFEAKGFLRKRAANEGDGKI